MKIFKMTMISIFFILIGIIISQVFINKNNMEKHIIYTQNDRVKKVQDSFANLGKIPEKELEKVATELIVNSKDIKKCTAGLIEEERKLQTFIDDPITTNDVIDNYRTSLKTICE